MTNMYDLESLGNDRFQQLCQALLAAKFPNTQCFPVGMPDGGRDASTPDSDAADATVYQVKFRKPTPNKITSPDEICSWLQGHITGELDKITKLANKGAKEYIVMTNAQCSSHADVGTRDRMQEWLSQHVSIPAQVWWHDDIDRRLDSETDIKRTYGFLRDMVGLAELIGAIAPAIPEHEMLQMSRADSRVSALLKYMRHQYERDAIVKFKQAELKPALLDVFVDVACTPAEEYARYADLITRHGDIFLHFNESEDADILGKWNGLISVKASSLFANRYNEGAPTASMLLDDLGETKEIKRHARIVLEGAPGQGKSTVAQYLCQVHRARLLGLTAEISKFPSQHMATEIRLPFHVDLRDLSSWLRRENPFDVTNTGEPQNWANTLEAFLAAQVRHDSGGINFDVTSLDGVTSATPVLLMLDGLDEVPDLGDRKAVVQAVNDAVTRMEYSCPSMLTVVTSRPSAFAKSPGFSQKNFTYLVLTDLKLQLVLEYTDKWLHARDISHKEAFERRRVLGEKLGHPHIADLARNPMQLAILLWLVDKKGLSLPDKRTALYNAYMDTFLDREATKSAVVRDERELLLELHGYLAWQLHGQAETGQSRGSISKPKLQSLLKRYLTREGYRKGELIDQLFAGITQRVMVLTSRVENTFEFEVQPLREYFAARYLYETAQFSPPGAERSGTRSDRFEALLRNPYWWNVTRFYAGFSDKGELANLADLLEGLHDEGDFSLIAYPREISATLIRDQVFSQRPKSAARVFDLLSTPRSLCLLTTAGTDRDHLSFSADSSGYNFKQVLLNRINKSFNAGEPDYGTCGLLNQNMELSEILEWWNQKWCQLRSELQRRQWLSVALASGCAALFSNERMSQIHAELQSATAFWRFAISSSITYSPTPDTAEFDSMMDTFRSAELTTTITYFSSHSPIRLAVRAMSPAYLRQLINRYGDRSSQIDLFHAVDRMGEEDFRNPLNLVCREVLELTKNRRAHKDIEAWRSTSEALAEILGGECKRTLSFSLVAGEVRSGNIGRDKGESLLDSRYPSVYRARYARQRGEDVAWWRRQVAEVSSESDIWFITAAMLRWAPPTYFEEGLRKLDSRLREYTHEDLLSLMGHIGTRRGIKLQASAGGGGALRIPHGLSHQSLFLLSLRMERNSAYRVAITAMKRSRDRDLASLYASHAVNFGNKGNFSLGDQEFVDEMSAMVKSVRRGGDNGTQFRAFWRITEPAPSVARRILSNPTDLHPVVLVMLNRGLTNDISQKAEPLEAVAGRERWFENDD